MDGLWTVYAVLLLSCLQHPNSDIIAK